MKAVRVVYRVGALAFGVLALVAGYYALTLRWVPHVDFDVIGFLWVLQNLPRLLAWLLTASFGAAAIYLGIRSATT